MSDDLNDEVFVLENGIISNENVPLILQHDLEDEGDAVIELGDEIPDFADAEANLIIQDVLGGNIPGMAQEDQPDFPGIGVPENGVHLSMSSTHSSVQSSSIAFEQGEVLDTSTPAFETEPFCYVNPSYQSSASDLSELTTSVEIRTENETASFKDLSKSMPGPSRLTDNSGEDIESQASGFSENKGTRTSKSPSETGYIADASAEASTNTFESIEVVMPNPPNSPTDLGRSLSRSGSSTQLLRRNRYRTRRRANPLNNPNRPSNLFRKFGSFLLILVLALLLAIIACLEGLLPRSSLTTMLILWGLTAIGSVGCFVKACWEEQNSPERPAIRSGYGSTGRTRPALSSSA